MTTSTRPRTWYDMTYDVQRDWEQREREHERDVDRLESRVRELNDDLDRRDTVHGRTVRGMKAEAEDYQDENARLAAALNKTREELAGAITLLRTIAVGTFSPAVVGEWLRKHGG